MENVNPDFNIFESQSFGGGVEDDQPNSPPDAESTDGVDSFESTLTPAEKGIYDAMSKSQQDQLHSMASSFSLADDSFIVSYGSDATTKIEHATKEALELTKVRDLGEAGTLMTGLMRQMRESTPQKKTGAFNQIKNYFQDLIVYRSDTGSVIEKAKTALVAQQQQLSSDNVQYDRMYKEVFDNYRLLTMYTISGKIKLVEGRKQLTELQKKAAETSDQGDIEAALAFEEQLRTFDQLLNELEGSKVLCMQTAPAIRVAKQNNNLLIQKFRVIIQTAIPAWYTQIQLRINQENTLQATRIASSAIDFTNEMIESNAKTLHQNSIAAATLAESEVIKIETLESAQQLLLETWDEVTKIHKEGQAQRNDSMARKADLEENFKNELIKRMNPSA